MSIFHITKGSVHRTLTRRGSSRERRMRSARRKFRSGSAREEERNLSNSRMNSQSRSLILFHMQRQEVEECARYTRTHTVVCVCVHLSRSSYRRGRCFQSRLYLVELESTTLPPSSLRKEPSEIYPPLPTSPPVFLVFFSLPLFLARSEALLGTSLRFSRA